MVPLILYLYLWTCIFFPFSFGYPYSPLSPPFRSLLYLINLFYLPYHVANKCKEN